MTSLYCASFSVSSSSHISIPRCVDQRREEMLSATLSACDDLPNEERTEELKRNLIELETRGFTIVNNIFTAEEIETLKNDFTTLVYPKAMSIIDNTAAKPRGFEESDTAVTSLYWKPDPDTLILQAGKGRYDFYRGFGTVNDGLFGKDAVLRNPHIVNIVQRLLHRDFTSYTGVIHNTVGSEDQYWHRDTDTLQNTGTDGKQMVLLDDFYFTCLAPITVPISMQNGATEFMVGSHRCCASDFNSLEQAQAEVPLGSALLFNGKCNHRGKANNSSEDRPVIYTVIHKLWYNDAFRRGVE